MAEQNNADSAEYISRAELLTGEKPGIYKADKPIIGYKKIHCARYERPWWWLLGNKELKCSKGVATLEIPEGSVVVRPENRSVDYSGPVTQNTSTKLRSDGVIFKEYKPSEEQKCPHWLKNMDRNLLESYYCYSSYNPSYQYKQNQVNKPKEALNTNIKNECTSGMHFFLAKEDADKYSI